MKMKMESTNSRSTTEPNVVLRGNSAGMKHLLLPFRKHTQILRLLWLTEQLLLLPLSHRSGRMDGIPERVMGVSQRLIISAAVCSCSQIGLADRTLPPLVRVD